MRVDQTLHGYRNGHTLLAASRHLSRPVRRVLLQLSDLSGPAINTRDLNDYVSGYPIPDERLYALARTWIADNGPRPGSVWTHTFLLNSEQIGMKWIGNLLDYFERPLSGGDYSKYEVALELPRWKQPRPPLEFEAFQSASFPAHLSELLERVFSIEASEATVIAPTPASIFAEDLAALIWSLQWPDLRSQFAFCTGAISLRQVGGRPFDLHFVPSSRINTIARMARNAGFDTSNIASGWPESNARSNSAWHIHGVWSSLQSTFWNCGPELEPHRSSAGRILHLHQLLKSDPDLHTWRTMIDFVSQWYPKPNSANSLKSWVLELAGANAPIEIRCADQLSALSQITNVGALKGWKSVLGRVFTCTQIEHGDRFDDELNAIFPTATDTARVELIALSANSMKPGSYVALMRQLPEELPRTAIERRPQILEWYEFWRSDRLASVALDWIPTVPAKDIPLTGIVRGMIESGCIDRLGGLEKRIGESVIDTAFDVLERDGGSGIDGVNSAELANTIRAHPERGIAWLKRCRKPPGSLVRLTIDELPPNDRRLRTLTASRWAEIVELVDPSTSDGISVFAFALAVGFARKSRAASALVSKTFPIVHASTIDHRLSCEDWGKISHAMPLGRKAHRQVQSEIPASRSEILRTGLMRAFARRRWPTRDFVKSVGNDNLLRRIVAEHSESKAAMRIGKRIGAEIANGEETISVRHQKILRPWLRKWPAKSRHRSN